MYSQTIYRIGDKAQDVNGRIGVVIDIDRDPNVQDSTLSQTIVVQFPDFSTLEGRAANFKAVYDTPFSTVGT